MPLTVEFYEQGVSSLLRSTHPPHFKMLLLLLLSSLPFLEFPPPFRGVSLPLLLLEAPCEKIIVMVDLNSSRIVDGLCRGRMITCFLGG